MEILYKKETIVQTEFDSKQKIIVVTWKSLSGHPYLKECVQMHVDLVKEKGAQALIIDVSEATGVPTQEEQSWFGSYVFPNYDKYGLKIIVTILPKSALTEMSARKWNQTASTFRFNTFETGSKENAFELVSQELGIKT
jgi:hypothetical protein